MPFRIKVFVSVLLALLVVLLLGPLLLPVPPLEDTAAPSALAFQSSSFLESGGVRLHYLDTGGQAGGEDGGASGDDSAGEPRAFLLLHGYPDNAAGWRALLPELALYGRAVAFDRPGFGLSERPLPGSWRRSENPYLPDAQVSQALAVLDSLGIEQAVWIGSSSGAVVALEAALAHPERVSSLVLVGAPVYAGRVPPVWLRPLLHTPQMDRLGPLLMRQLGSAPGMNLFASQWADADRIEQSDIDAYRLTFSVEDWDRGLWEVTKASRVSGVAERLAEVQVPALVVSGAQDPIVAPAESERLARELPQATFALMDGCGHLPQVECPAAFAELLTDWLAESAGSEGE
jgi:pimeloyl-ACP methyl ester carboxylesterase